MKRRILPIVLLATFHLAHSAEPTAREIAEKADTMNRTDSEVATFEMRLVDSKGREKVRRLKSFSLTPKSDPEKGVLRFLDPPDVAGTAVLTLEQPGKEDEQWIYLPALKRTRRIAGSQRHESFMGSDLSYDDLRPLDIDAYTYKVLRSEKLPTGDCWVLESRPVKGGKAEESAYSRSVGWIRKTDYVPLKSELYDKEGILLKLIAYEGYKTEAGVSRPDAVMVENRKKGTRTSLRYLDRQLNPALQPDLFTTRSLEMQ